MNSDVIALKAFVRGLTLNSSWHTYREEKPELLFDMSKIFMRLQIPHKIIKLKNGGAYQLVLDEDALRGRLFDEPYEKNDLMWFDDEGVCHMKVTSVRGYKPHGYLYDFTVWEDHTYSTGLYTVHNSHLDSPVHTRFMHYRSPIEEYERTRLFGRSAAFWEHPHRDFIEPWSRSMVSSDSFLEGAPRGFFMGALLGGPAGAVLGTMAGGAYGAGRYAIGAEAGVPSDIQRKRELEAYFDKLEYLKAKRLHSLTGEPDYLRKAGETMTGLNPLGMTTAGWTSMYRSLPYAERPFFNAFMNTANPDERDRIVELMPEDVGNLLQIRWGINDGVRDRKALADFRSSQDVSRFIGEEGIPEVGWGGWAPATHLEDVKLKTVEQEGFDTHDFGLGWKDQMRRMEASPFTPGPVQMTKLTHYDGQFLQGEDSVNKYEVQTAIQRIIRQFGASGSVTIDQIPGGHSSSPTGATPSVIEVNITRSRALTATMFSPDRQLTTMQRALMNA
jgi:hypothetical protein